MLSQTETKATDQNSEESKFNALLAEIISPVNNQKNLDLSLCQLIAKTTITNDDLNKTNPVSPLAENISLAAKKEIITAFEALDYERAVKAMKNLITLPGGFGSENSIAKNELHDSLVQGVLKFVKNVPLEFTKNYSNIGSIPKNLLLIIMNIEKLYLLAVSTALHNRAACPTLNGHPLGDLINLTKKSDSASYLSVFLEYAVYICHNSGKEKNTYKNLKVVEQVVVNELKNSDPFYIRYVTIEVLTLLGLFNHWSLAFDYIKEILKNKTEQQLLSSKAVAQTALSSKALGSQQVSLFKSTVQQSVDSASKLEKTCMVFSSFVQKKLPEEKMPDDIISENFASFSKLMQNYIQTFKKETPYSVSMKELELNVDYIEAKLGEDCLDSITKEVMNIPVTLNENHFDLHFLLKLPETDGMRIEPTSRAEFKLIEISAARKVNDKLKTLFANVRAERQKVVALNSPKF